MKERTSRNSLGLIQKKHLVIVGIGTQMGQYLSAPCEENVVKDEIQVLHL